MNLDGIRVNHASLDQASSDMMQSVKQIDDRMNRLESELEPLRSNWAGNAQQSYIVAKAKWDTAIQDMRDLLNQSQSTVTESNSQYMAADKRGAAHFQ